MITYSVLINPLSDNKYVEKLIVSSIINFRVEAGWGMKMTDGNSLWYQLLRPSNVHVRSTLFGRLSFLAARK